MWFDGEKVVPLTKTATLRDENVAFFQIGLFRETSEVPETIIIDHCIEATTLALWSTWTTSRTRFEGMGAARCESGTCARSQDFT